MPSIMNINGLKIEFDNGTLTISGLREGRSSAKKLELDRDGVINGNVLGDIDVHGKDVKLVIEGSVDGDINCANLEVGGNIDGDINAASVSAKGGIKGDVNAAFVRT